MKIPITNNNTKEILEVIKSFPSGLIKVIDNEAYWDTESKIQFNNQTINNPQMIQPKKDTFSKMRDELFNAFSV